MSGAVDGSPASTPVARVLSTGRSMSCVEPVVGLGNPGRKHVGTRHNVGFNVMEEVARRYGSTQPKAQFGGEVVEARLNGVKTLLLCPLTFMNNSGRSVIETQRFFKLESSDILVVCDDFHLPLAKLRIRSEGSAGGQKGLADLPLLCATDRLLGDGDRLVH